MAKKKNTEDKELKNKKKRLEVLKASYEMYEKSKAETIEVRNSKTDKRGNKMYSESSTDDTIELIETMQNGIRDEYVQLGGDINDLYVYKEIKGKKIIDRSRFEEIIRKEMEAELANEELLMKKEPKESESKNVDDILDELVDKDIKEAKKESTQSKEEHETVYESNENETVTLGSVNMDITLAKGNNIKFDAIPIPSKGRCYKHKLSKLPIAYLTANDENMIMSPNLYQDGSFLDYMIKAKIMTTKIDTDELIPGDREAILVWLRASGYGPLYPITATDKESGKDFETVVDLSKLKYKDFNLNADEDGYFDYTMPVTGDKIKFKYLSYKDVKAINEETIREDASLKKEKLVEMCTSMRYYIENDSTIKPDVLKNLNKSIDTINEYANTIDTSSYATFNHLVTNRLTKSIMSVNDVTDRKYIEEYVALMNIKDAISIRKYMNDNEPGLDLNIMVERPESLGGGSVSLFLTFDQYIFLNIKD